MKAKDLFYLFSVLTLIVFACRKPDEGDVYNNSVITNEYGTYFNVAGIYPSYGEPGDTVKIMGSALPSNSVVLLGNQECNAFEYNYSFTCFVVNESITDGIYEVILVSNGDTIQTGYDYMVTNSPPPGAVSISKMYPFQGNYEGGPLLFVGPNLGSVDSVKVNGVLVGELGYEVRDTLLSIVIPISSDITGGFAAVVEFVSENETVYYPIQILESELSGPESPGIILLPTEDEDPYLPAINALKNNTEDVSHTFWIQTYANIGQSPDLPYSGTFYDLYEIYQDNTYYPDCEWEGNRIELDTYHVHEIIDEFGNTQFLDIYESYWGWIEPGKLILFSTYNGKQLVIQ
jgi:hypothetical protein